LAAAEARAERAEAALSTRDTELAEAQHHLAHAYTGDARPAADAELAAAWATWDAELEERLAQASAAVTAALSTRETKLANLRQQLDHARTEGIRQAVEAELAAAKVAWNAELEERLAQASAAATANLEESRAAWQAETENRLAEMAAQAETRINEAQASWRQQNQEALAQAAETWRNKEAARLALVEVRWRDQSSRFLAEAQARATRAEAALTEARAHAEMARERGGEELRYLREELIARLLRSADITSQV
jgi:hypothetical protein